jgi:MFS family permease
VASFLLVRAIRARPEPAPVAAARPSFLGEFRSGLAYSSRSRPVRALMIAITTVTLGAGAMNALMVFFVIDNLHSKPDFYGVMGMGEGLGAVAGTLTAAWICARLGDVRVFCYGLIVAGIGFLAFARLDNLWQAVAALAVLGIPLGALNVALSPILLRSVPRELIGRVVGILNPVQYLASMVAALVAGWLASTVLLGLHVEVGPVTFSRIDTIFTGAGLLVAVGGIYAWAALRGGAPAPAPSTGPAPDPSTGPVPDPVVPDPVVPDPVVPAVSD